MIPASKKKSFTELPESLTDQLKSTFNNESLSTPSEQSTAEPAQTEIKEEIQTVTNPEPEVKPKRNDRNGQINICVPPETKTDWKVLFTKSNVNITQGIIFAVEHLKNEIERGEVMLTVGGVIKKNSNIQ